MFHSILKSICKHSKRRRGRGRSRELKRRASQFDCLEQRTLLTTAPLISEFVAVNNASVIDGFGETPDWIEIANPSTEPVVLNNYFLSDDPSNLRKWRFPDRIAIESGQHLVVLASGRDTIDVAGYPHTNFRLSAAGEYLALSDSQGNILTEFGSAERSYPSMRVDISYGFAHNDESYASVPSLLGEPTPGERNGSETLSGVLPPAIISRSGGLFSDSIEVTIQAPEPGLAVVYTTTGDAPSADVGTAILPIGQDAPAATTITVSSTTIVQAITIKPNWLSPFPTARSYLFPADVISNAADSGEVSCPQHIVTCSIADNQSAAPFSDAEILDALYALPTVSVTMDNADLWSSERGIYVHPLQRGPTSERNAHMEVFDENHYVATNVTIAIMGRSSRTMEKHAFRVNIVDNQGSATTTNIPSLQAIAEWDVDTVALRVNAQDSVFVTPDVGEASYTYMRDTWVRNTLATMGQPSPGSDFAHLYLNGSYWGIITVAERVRTGFIESRFGNDGSVADIISTAPDRDPLRPDVSLGSAEDWGNLFEQARAVPFDTEAYFSLQGKTPFDTSAVDSLAMINIKSLVDHVVLRTYSMSGDWIWNILAIDIGDGFRFIAWDAELDLKKTNRDWTDEGRWRDEASGTPLELVYRFLAIPEFKIELGDAIYRHMFNDGALTPEVSVATWNSLAENLEPAIVAELARWGSHPKTVWDDAIRAVAEEIIPESYRLALQRFRERGWYPSIDPPIVSNRGGSVVAGQQVTLSSGDGRIYFTTDGTDPRAIYGQVSESAMQYADPLFINETTRLRARILSDTGEWSALEDLVYEVEVDQASADSLRITEIHYHPEPNGDAEFIEFTNIGQRTIKLTDVRLDGGIHFDFSEGRVPYLEPGNQVVVVRSESAFAQTYGSQVPIAGQYSGALSNGGEEIIVRHIHSGDIERFTFDDNVDWPKRADGAGYSLQLIDTLLPSNQASSWRSSAVLGGTPGRPSYQIGDANLDGIFDSSDFVQIFQTGYYQNTGPNIANWESGDWNGDGRFDSTDLVIAFQFSLYVW